MIEHNLRFFIMTSFVGKRKIAMLVIFTLTLVVLVAVYMFKRCENTTNKKKIEIAIQYLINHPTFSIPSGDREYVAFVRNNFLPYESVQEFLSANQECCRVSDTGRDGFQLSPIAKFSSNFGVFVIIDYKVKIKNRSGVEYHRVSGTEVAISHCGQVIDAN